MCEGLPTRTLLTVTPPRFFYCLVSLRYCLAQKCGFDVLERSSCLYKLHGLYKQLSCRQPSLSGNGQSSVQVHMPRHQPGSACAQAFLRMAVWGHLLGLCAAHQELELIYLSFESRLAQRLLLVTTRWQNWHCLMMAFLGFTDCILKAYNCQMNKP